MITNNISYQLTPAGSHSRNAAERAIQTFKYHFVAGKLAHDDLVKHLPTGSTYSRTVPKQISIHPIHSDRKRFWCEIYQRCSSAPPHPSPSQEHSITQEPSTIFSDIYLKWDYINRTYELSIPGYVFKALLRFNHNLPCKPQHSNYLYTSTQYGAKVQYSMLKFVCVGFWDFVYARMLLRSLYISHLMQSQCAITASAVCSR